MTEWDDASLASRERALVERMRREYAPPAPTPWHRAAFGDALRRRLARRPRPVLAPALTLAAAAWLLWLALPSSSPPARVPDPAAWEYELLVSSDVSPAADRDESRFLPDDYRAIGRAFLGS